EAGRESTDSGEASRISLLLRRVSSGENGALALVFEAAYSELRALAQARLRCCPRAACDGLDSSALIHEVFLRLARRGDLRAEHRPHFFRYAGRVMQSVIVDGARERMALRRGGGTPHQVLDYAGEPAWLDSDARI